MRERERLQGDHGLEEGASPVLAVYRTPDAFPAEEKFGLVSQMRRAASSVPTNIAEGRGRDGEAELGRFCRIAVGSSSELEYRLILAHDLGLLGTETFRGLDADVNEVKRMLYAFIRSLRRNILSAYRSRLPAYS
jgi:four helix bundle protein